ncbi:hypothetical protein [Paenibacillus cremeus]|uniref:Signal transduction histidine kinase n=1 Tax=Paenibacillus cremeus TaxID=2163881 RepID=A0A559K3E7_9BACL|nr:hypothetical protein [Paenibacillus cremeus]TVY06661.1 hypothetical protein FPZ49_27825 [Paenibacillus cremeus]
MDNSASIVTFMIISFALALILIMKKDSLPAGVKRPLAILALVMVAFSFVLMVYSFFSAAG